MNGLYHDNPLGYPYGHHDRFSFGGPRFLSHYNPMVNHLCLLYI
jgi:hypothetical protein